MQIDVGQTFLIGFGLLCVLPFVVFAVIAFIVYRAGQQRMETWFAPDQAKLQEQVAAMRAKQPNLSREQLAGHIIQRQALRAGIVGAITGVGGFWTLPIALPVDLALSFQIQARLVNFIAYLYNERTPEGLNAQARTYLIMTGSSQVTQTTTNFLTRLAVRVAGKSFAKMIPLAGALISFAVNYVIVQVMGRAAVRWYARQTSSDAGGNVG
jgi:phage-related protein